jgi:Protein of unknown function (DUF2800)
LSQHAIHAPSSAHRWPYCPGSAYAIARLDDYYGPEEDGEESADGTAAHDEIDIMLKPLSGMLATAEDFDQLANPVPMHHPAAYGLALVRDLVRKLLVQAPRVIWIEQRVTLTGKIWGRCDIFLWEPISRTLTIIDYKNGMRAVDAEENEQTGIYAGAVIRTHNLDPVCVDYFIVQPNDWREFVPRVKLWRESRDDLEKRLARFIAASEQTYLAAGPHCRDCPLFGVEGCEPSKDMLLQFAPVIAGFVRPADVRPEQVALFFALEKPITDAIKNFKSAWSKSAVKADIAPPRMKFVAAEGHRKWNDEQAAAKALGLDNLPGFVKLPTPAQAEEAGFDVSALASKGKPFKTLAPADDRRKTWVKPSAETMFAATIKGLTSPPT